MRSISEKDLILLSNKKSGMSIVELIELCKLIDIHKPKRILEIGTKHGRTTINMAKFSPEDAEIFSVDILVLDKPEICELSEYKKITFLQGDTLTFDFRTVGKDQFDFILVDANHLEKFVINDTKIAYHLIKPEGIIVWHDYNKDQSYNNLQVTQALNRLGIKPNVIGKTSLVWLKVK